MTCHTEGVQMTHRLAGVDDMSSGKGADDMSPIEKNLLLKQHNR